MISIVPRVYFFGKVLYSSMLMRWPDVRWCSLDQRLGGNSP